VSIILSSVLLILDSPLNNPDQPKSKIYDIFNKAFTALFALEMILKIISTGFLFNSEKGKQAYIRNSWNIIDCLVVIVSLFLYSFLNMFKDFCYRCPGRWQHRIKVLKSPKVIQSSQAVKSDKPI